MADSVVRGCLKALYLSNLINRSTELPPENRECFPVMLHSKQSQGITLTRGRENDQENEKRTTYQKERETQRHCRASLLEIEIEHSVEV